MAESNELQVLDKITTEVDEAQIKVILATQCIKAQAFLVDKLKKQVQRNRETIGFISSANLKLESEITQAEHEITSFRIAKETMNMANVELKKELLVTKEKKIDVIEKVQSGEKRYEDLWLECKSRYESLPHVQKLLKAAQMAQNLKDKMIEADEQAESLINEIQEKRKACLNADKNKIIQLAEFIIHERPKMLDKINEKSRAIAILMNELKSLNINSYAETKVVDTEKEETIGEAKSDKEDEYKNMDKNSMIMPKLHLDSLDIDDLISARLDQVKMANLDYTTRFERKEFSKSYLDIGSSLFNRKADIDESISSYFTKPSANEENDYSKKKLINILEDVKVNANYAMDMLSKVNPDTLQTVELISADTTTATTRTIEEQETSKNKVMEPIQSEEIEEIEMTSSNTDNIVEPPTQFLDGSVKSQKSQDKKTVSFDLTIASQDDVISGNIKINDAPEEKNANETTDSMLNASAVSDDGFDKIKDMVLKKRNLDLTPPFMYAKNTLQMKTDEKIVTSKFFRANENVNDDTKQQNKQNEQPEAESKTTNVISIKENTEFYAEDDVASPEKQKFTDELFNSYKTFSGYLFNHGLQGLPESLDVSTTGYDDADDFPHFDSSLLLSPKADLPMSAQNSEIQSQEAPNFLSGLRKTGLSFFGLPAAESKADSGAPNQGSSGFSFNFGGEEKKNRGGLFSMFQ